MSNAYRWAAAWGAVLAVFSFSAAAEVPPTAGGVAAANVRATLGDMKPEKLGGVELELRSPPPVGLTQKFYVQGAGRLRVEIGVSPLVESVYSFDGKRFFTKGFASDPALQPPDRVDLRATALLAAGGFSLAHFRKGLVLEGRKRMGPEEYHVLSSPLEGGKVEFFVDTASLLLRRVVIHSDPGDQYDNYRVVYEFQPPREGPGPRVPGGMSKSDIGARSTGESDAEFEVARFETGRNWPDSFFRDLKTNFGRNELSGARLAGNATSAMWSEAQQRAVVYTNLTHEIVKRAGYAEGGKLSLAVSGKSFGIYFTESQDKMTPAMTAAGCGVLTPSRRLPYGVLLLYGAGFKGLAEGLKPLSPVEIVKE